MHLLIIGKTGSGKTWTARELARRIRAAGRPFCVLDPLHLGKDSTDWPGALDVVRTAPEMRRRFWSPEFPPCFWIIDEAGRTLDAQIDQPLMTMGRHMGHSVALLSQRATIVAKTMREQCGAVILGTQAMTDRQAMAAEFDDERLLDAVPDLVLSYSRDSRRDEYLRYTLGTADARESLDCIADEILNQWPERNQAVNSWDAAALVDLKILPSLDCLR